MSGIFSATVSFKNPVNGFAILKSALRVFKDDLCTESEVRDLGDGQLSFKVRELDGNYPAIVVSAPGDNPINSGDDYRACSVSFDQEAHGYEGLRLQSFVADFMGELRAIGVYGDVEYNDLLRAMHAM